jgi:hypothetical protein
MKHKEKPATAQGVVAGKSLQPEDGAKRMEISDNTEPRNNTHADRRIPDWYGRVVSRFDGVWGKSKKPLTMEHLIDAVTGERFSSKVREQVKGYREFLQDTSKERAKPFKENLPSVTIAKVYGEGERRLAKNGKFTGLTVIDIDHCGADRTEKVKKRLESIPNVLMAFVSPSMDGVKAVMYLCPPEDITGEENYKARYEQARQIVINCLPSEYGDMIVDNTKDSSRLCFLSYDPAPYISKTNLASLMPIEPAKGKKSVRATDERHHKRTGRLSAGGE